MGKYADVDDYIKDQEKLKSELIKELRAIVQKAAPKAEEKIMWSQPVYKSPEGPFCFIKAHKDHVNIGFWRGAEMQDKRGLLEGDGKKMRHIKISEKKDINKTALTDFIKQGLKLNKELGDPTK